MYSGDGMGFPRAGYSKSMIIGANGKRRRHSFI
jgi:hypothetical protein